MNKFFLPIFLIIASVGIFISYIDPTYEEIKKLKAENTQYNQIRDKSQELRAVRDDLLKKYSFFKTEDLEKIKKFLPDHVDNVRLVMDIDGIAFSHGFTIKDVKVDSNSSKDSEDQIEIIQTKDFDSVVLNFTTVAEYDDFKAFLADLRNSLRLVDVVSLKFDDAGGDGRFKFSVGIKTYWLK